MRPILAAVCLGLFALPALAQPAGASVDWSSAKVIEVDMSNYAFDPATLTLQHGVPYRLHFVNQSGGGHDFSAKDFFAQAVLDPATAAALKNGAVEVAGGKSVDLDVVAPAAGHFESHCTHFSHAMLGMKGQIDVQ
jgi:plastocyanin